MRTTRRVPPCRRVPPRSSRPPPPARTGLLTATQPLRVQRIWSLLSSSAASRVSSFTQQTRTRDDSSGSSGGPNAVTRPCSPHRPANAPRSSPCPPVSCGGGIGLCCWTCGPGCGGCGVHVQRPVSLHGLVSCEVVAEFSTVASSRVGLRRPSNQFSSDRARRGSVCLSACGAALPPTSASAPCNAAASARALPRRPPSSSWSPAKRRATS